MLQPKPQLVPSHVADSLGAVGHAVHDVPHVATDELLTQVPLQDSSPAGQLLVCCARPDSDVVLDL